MQCMVLPMIKGRTIRKLRERVGESQTEFAKRFGIRQASLSRWELDQSPVKGPAAELFKRIAAELEDA